jgi:hypothetical protein
MRKPQAAGERWPQPDFLPHPAHPPLLAWLGLACAALVFALAVDDWLRLAAADDEIQRQIERFRAAQRPLSKSVKVAPAVDPGTARAAWRVAALLEHPWRSLFESTERNAAAEVQWLRVEHDAERGDVRLEGTAASRDAVLVTLDALAAAPQWRDVMLVRVEDAGTPAAPVSGLRFELRARHGIGAISDTR